MIKSFAPRATVSGDAELELELSAPSAQALTTRLYHHASAG